MNKIRVIFLLVSLFVVSSSFPRISIQCDVIYQNSNGSWSNFFRTKVDFLTGEEMGYLGDRSLYAAIWFSHENCAILRMKNNNFVSDVADSYYMYGFFLADALNEGEIGIEVNSNNNRLWKIYGKDENSFLIDPMFRNYPFNSYNEGIRKNINNGVIVKRVRP